MSHHRSGRRALDALVALAAVALLGAPLAAQQPTPAASRAGAAGGEALSLEEALSLIERRSESVRIAAAGVDRARGQLRQARSQLFPQLTGTVGYQRTIQSQFQEISERFGGEEPPPGEEPGGDDLADSPLAQIFASENTVTLGLQFNQNVYTGGRVAAQQRAARAGQRAAELGVRTALAEAKLQVTEAYFDALLADRLVAIAESSLVQTERTFRQARLARDVGTTAEFDVLRAQVTRDNQRPAVIQARTQRDVAYLRLRQLLELPATQPLALTTGLEATVPPVRMRATSAPTVTRVDAPVDVEMLLAERAVSPEALAGPLAAADTVAGARSALRQARENVVAQEEQLRVVRAQRLPSLAVSSQYQRFAYPISGLPGVDDFFPNWTVSVGVQLPLLTGGRVRGELQVAQANLAEARAQQQQAEEIAALDVQLALAQFEQAAEAYAASAGTAEQATRAYTIAEVRYREGISTQVELTDSRLLLQQALANRAQAARDLSVAQARLALLADLPLGAVAGQAGGARGGAGAAGQGGSAPPQQQPQQQQQGRSAAGGAGGFPQQ